MILSKQESRGKVSSQHPQIGTLRGIFLCTPPIHLSRVLQTERPRFYIVYPQSWDFKFTPQMLDFLRTTRRYTFQPLNRLKDTLPDGR